MFAYRSGDEPVLAGAKRSACVLAVAATAALAGCASTHPNYAGAVPAPPVQIAQTSELEADGLPAQPAPRIGANRVPDDPSQPFSPNYGGVNPSRAPVSDSDHDDDAHRPGPYLPPDLPPAFRRQLAAAIAVAD